MKMYLDTPVERRPVKDRDAVSFALEFPPPSNGSLAMVSAHRDWQTRAGWMLANNRPGRMPGPVTLTLTYEERAGRRDLETLIRPVIELCLKHGIIDSDHRSILRGVNAGWGAAKGVSVTIETVRPVLGSPA